MAKSTEERGDIIDQMDEKLSEIEEENAQAGRPAIVQEKAKELRVLTDNLIAACDGAESELDQGVVAAQDGEAPKAG